MQLEYILCVSQEKADISAQEDKGNHSSEHVFHSSFLLLEKSSSFQSVAAWLTQREEDTETQDLLWWPWAFMCSLSWYMHWGCWTQGNVTSTHIVPSSIVKIQDPGPQIPPHTALSSSQLTVHLSVLLSMRVTPSHSYCCSFTNLIMSLTSGIIPVVYFWNCMDYNAHLSIHITWFVCPPEPEIETDVTPHYAPQNTAGKGHSRMQGLERRQKNSWWWYMNRSSTIPPALLCHWHQSYVETCLLPTANATVTSSVLVGWYVQHRSSHALHTKQRHVFASRTSLSSRRWSEDSPGDLFLRSISFTASQHWPCLCTCAWWGQYGGQAKLVISEGFFLLVRCRFICFYNTDGHITGS